MSLAALALSGLVFLADLNDQASASGRLPPANREGIRYVVLGNSEANAILPHANDVFQLWESRATLIDRLIQLDVALKMFPRVDAVLLNINPVELAVSPHCLAFRTPWPVGRENTLLIRRRTLVQYKYAGVMHVLLNPAKLLDAVDRYLAVDPVKGLHRMGSVAPPSQAFRTNGSLVRHDPRVAPEDKVFDRPSSEAIRLCHRFDASEHDAMVSMRQLRDTAHAAGLNVFLIVTPLHSAYRESLDAYLSATMPKRGLSADRLIARLKTLDIPVIDHSRAFDHEELAFLNGDHLSSSGEVDYTPLLSHDLTRVRASVSSHLDQPGSANAPP